MLLSEQIYLQGYAGQQRSRALHAELEAEEMADNQDKLLEACRDALAELETCPPSVDDAVRILRSVS